MPNVGSFIAVCGILRHDCDGIKEMIRNLSYNSDEVAYTVR